MKPGAAFDEVMKRREIEFGHAVARSDCCLDDSHLKRNLRLKLAGGRASDAAARVRHIRVQ